ncbi:putative lipid II flippase FtsW [Lapillicoccus jejuensis]|uniref:Probable peptidoglycan glycosyltransferase FtsW n=1 Tax=Lapillicoccus jejuensis TaxID=402171 RepID=A0A542E6S3_9MICO|nr:putative lipid II flippase FtsW [Lapillicoccus jejuensis]TQJ11028.1 cell division-specific peptidoglycan biosynthesis regulator FtsW [Lapillicoccus jejuensis]
MTAAGAPVPAGRRPRDTRGDATAGGLRGAAARLESPVTTYYVLLGTTALLVVFGLVMVLSASTVTSIEAGGSAFSDFANQAMFAVLGVVVAAVAAHLPVRWFRRLAVPAFATAIALQLLTFTGLGVTVLGNRNWIRLGPVTVQPSEILKLALVLLGAVVLSKKQRLLDRPLHVLVPFLVPCVLVGLGLVLKGGDLGTTLVLVAIVGAVLFTAGVPGRFFGVAAVVAALAVVALVTTSGNRMARVQAYLGGHCTSDEAASCYQTVHGLYALADGGWWGVGLGASKEKWSWLPEAHNDFIFAIIGEELGLPGTLVVLALFGVLAWACYRLVVRSTDPFVRVASAGVMVWILVQALINIGVVIGLLPVIGIPLPLVSSGGSALVMTLAALGMLLAFARNEPGARELLAERPSLVRSSLSVLPSRRHRRTP